MKHEIFVGAILLIVFFVSHATGLCCSSFHAPEPSLSIVGKNYDWMVTGGMIVINKKGVRKTAFVRYRQTVQNPATWTSKYGSVTFCQYGVEIPGSGMNERGLVVSSQAMPGSKRPELDGRPSIERRQWLQYQLDNYGTVEEVLINFDKIQVRPDSFGSHYFIADAKGNSAVIEFIDGETKMYTGRSLPFRVLTNSEYRSCSKFVKKKLPELDPQRNFERFVTAAKALEEDKSEFSSDPIGASFKLLKDISQGDFTKWSIVYDARKLNIFFRTVGNPNIRSVNLKKFDLSCNTPIRYLKIEHEGDGEVTDRFKDYNIGVAFGVFYSSFEQSPFIPRVDPAQILHRTTYMDRHVCEEGASTEIDAGHSGRSRESNDEAAVVNVINAWENYWNEKDANALLSLIHEEAEIMYGLGRLADKKEYTHIVEERMRTVGPFVFKDHEIKTSNNTATVGLMMKIGWGDFPGTFQLTRENDKWLVTSFKYKL